MASPERRPTRSGPPELPRRPPAARATLRTPDPSSDYFYGYDAQEDNFSIAASSYHPGGCNFAFLDGSVRFIKDSINTWPYNPANGAPTNVSYNSSTGLFTAGPPMGVYQALSTRAGTEVVSADQY